MTAQNLWSPLVSPTQLKDSPFHKDAKAAHPAEPDNFHSLMPQSAPDSAPTQTGNPTPPAEPDRPPYYTRFPIDPATFGMLNSLPAWAFNVVKYVCRAPYKHDTEEADIRKAIRYCEMRLEELKRRREGTIGDCWNRPL